MRGKVVNNSFSRSTRIPLTVIPILENLIRVIHSPAQLMILTFLYVVEEGDMVYLLNQTGLTWGNLSAYVHKLKDTGNVEVKRDLWMIAHRPG